MMADIELISKEEKEFIQLYYTTLRSYQERSANKLVYTRIPMTYAILNKLPLKTVVFHPISIVYAEKLEQPTFEHIKKAIQDIIEFELYAEECLLSGSDLTLLIKHFKSFGLQPSE